MSRGGRGGQKSESGNIYSYFLRDRVTSESKATCAMGDKQGKSKTDPELLAFLKGMEERITERIDGVDNKLLKIVSRVVTAETSIEELQNKLSETEGKLLEQQVHDRKYNLLVYGVEGHEINPAYTMTKIRTLARDKLLLPKDQADNMLLRHAHRLQKRDGPAPIIVVFLQWADRWAFLEGAKNLRREDRISVRTDLPPQLRKERGHLAAIAYKLRKKSAQTRIMEKGRRVWLESRANSSLPWEQVDPELLPELDEADDRETA